MLVSLGSEHPHLEQLKILGVALPANVLTSGTEMQQGGMRSSHRAAAGSCARQDNVVDQRSQVRSGLRINTIIQMRGVEHAVGTVMPHPAYAINLSSRSFRFGQSGITCVSSSKNLGP